MKSHARQILSRLGSVKAKELGWRDMWAMVTRKGDLNLKLKVPYKPIAESYSKSTEFHSWGTPVSLNVQIPLLSLAGREKKYIQRESQLERRNRVERCLL